MTVLPRQASVELADFDFDWYRQRYLDLATFSDREIADHYSAAGKAEGRSKSPLALREHYIEVVRHEPSILEIVQFCNPAIIGDHVRYFEV